MSTAARRRLAWVSERGQTVVSMTPSEARELRSHRICTVEPGEANGQWVISDVKRVGNIALEGLDIVLRPKVPLRSLLYIATVAHEQVAIEEADFAADEDVAVPVALAASLITAMEQATRRGLVKDYRSHDETSQVMRGRWDVMRQLSVRPGLPIPIELTIDEFTDDTDENRLLHTALRRVLRFDGLDEETLRRGRALLALFTEVGVVAQGGTIEIPRSNRRTAALRFPLALARFVLESTTFTHTTGSRRSGSFLVDPAQLFEKFVGVGLRAALRPAGFDVSLQDGRSWRFDIGERIILRPDIVIFRRDTPIAVADTKYKVWGATNGSPPNADVYQAVAYALALRLDHAHLIYASGEVEPRGYEIRTAGVTVMTHSISLDGTPVEMLASVRRLGVRLGSA